MDHNAMDLEDSIREPHWNRGRTLAAGYGSPGVLQISSTPARCALDRVCTQMEYGFSHCL